MTSPTLEFSPEDIQHMLRNIDSFSPDEIEEIMNMADELEERRYVSHCHSSLIGFTKHMDDKYIVGSHHRILANKLSDIERGKITRLCVNIAPRHGKSHLVSTMYPAWFLGKNPAAKVMLVSHTADLAVDFGRKVRDIIGSTEFQRVFPGVSLSKDNKSAGRWTTSAGGEFFACGIGAKLAGRGADLLLIDDPHSEQDIINGNYEVFEKAYAWFAYGARTRLMPGGRIAIVQCMTGDTAVLMADNTEKPLRDIKVGDEVATYDQNILTTSKVLNHRSNGIDKVFTINTTSRTVRANERHPFLVQNSNGERRWTKIKNLKVGDTLVSLRDAHGKQEQRLNPESVKHVSRKTAGTENTPMHRISLRGTTVNIRAKIAQWTGVLNLRTSEVGVHPTTTRKSGLKVKGVEAQRLTEPHTSNTGTASQWKNTIRCCLNKMVSALYVNSHPLNTTPAHIGMGSCVSTTATTQEKLEPYYVTTATSQLGIQRTEEQPSQWQSTSPFTLTTITSIEYTGDEEVFDIQVERTENFIANHIVSHNTRWSTDDLTGRVVKDMAMNERGDQYEVIEFPAILNEGEPDEKALWSDFFDLDALKQIKAGMPAFQWNAQYQQNPTGEEGAIVKREWWQTWKKEKPPKCEYLIMSLDSAAETKNRNDYSALTTWGVFFNEETDRNRYEIILLNAIKERYEFPELKDKMIQEYNEWDPDCFIVEKKSSGVALYQEMRRMGLPVQEYTPHRGTGDKMARLNSISDIIRSGMVWVPETRWAEELVDEIAAFPAGSHDDLLDSAVMAIMRFRNGGFIRLDSDQAEEEPLYRRRRGGYY
jgi:predicted phage terminase large subunit-like protein